VCLNLARDLDLDATRWRCVERNRTHSRQVESVTVSVFESDSENPVKLTPPNRKPAMSSEFIVYNIEIHVTIVVYVSAAF